MKLKAGIIGAGLISRIHMEAYNADDRIKIAILCDLDAQLRKKTARQYSIPDTTDNYHALLGDNSIELIDVCLPHYLHYPVVMECFRAGKHVILEKPISMTIKEADEMIAAANKYGKRFFVAHNERFVPANQTAKEMIDRGEIGQPFLVTSAIIGDVVNLLNDPCHWKGTWDKAGGGALIDSGIHFIDILQYFFGEAVAAGAIRAKVAVTIKEKAEDNAVVNFKFTNGVLGNLAITQSAGGDNWHFQKDIYGTNGSIHIVNESDAPITLVKNKQSPISLPVEKDSCGEGWWKYSIMKGISHFVDCIADGKKTQVTPEDARSALKTVLKIYKAS
ncbi:MAG: Gfo/Idh/MocA family oxidoreductase [Verrucomicrobia bacterium]|nr:Gfo/Idh/MocA family oxidoreductase [Verrucomicrobiota bacterium]